MKNIIKKYFKRSAHNMDRSIMQDLLNPTWSGKSYNNFAKEAYTNNVIASRCINLIAKSAATIDWILYKKGKNQVIENHSIL
ncbi:MAG: hypothetical protein K0T99_03495, partial [Alphaproteobacteria bacterium]|nr:hypothetical protein [Alphaproteobacteria bacterium]